VLANILEDAVGRAFRHALFCGQVCFALALSLLVTAVLVSAEAYEAGSHMAQLLETAF
jgi:hypothetical protein